jgi:putative phage-type endonuclease
MLAKELVDTSTLSRDEWLNIRRMGIGGSDVAAILGLSRYKSPMSVYLDKIGESEPVEDNPKMEAGRRLEPVIRQWFADKTEKRVTEFHAVLRHPHHDFMLANIDGWLPEENAGLECKNTEGFNRDDWANDQAPIEYVLQTNHYMACTGARRWYIAVLINGWDLQVRVVERDEEIISMLIEREEYFWRQHVQAKIPPAFMASDTAYVNGLYRRSNPLSRIDLSPEKRKLITTASSLKKQMDDVKRSLEAMKNQIKGEAGENELIYVDGELVATWKADKNGKRTFKLIGEE